MNILEEIVQSKLKEVADRKETHPVKLLERSLYFETQTVSLNHYLKREDKSGIIAEFKRKSPSKGSINRHADVERTTIGYMQAGASALSVLTDSNYFGGSSDDLTIARKFNFCPILRKDFVVDEYQIVEAKSIGADAILLIARILTKSQIEQFSSLSSQLGLEVLLEIHEEQELEKYHPGIQNVGINNRNLNSFEVDFDNAIRLAKKLPTDVLKVAESGINSAEDIQLLRANGFDGFLIGERFMRYAEPHIECKKFIKNSKVNQHVTA